MSRATLANVDIRTWQPRSIGDPFRLPLTHRVSGAIQIPPGLGAGTYLLGMYLPDALESVANRSAFAVRVANDIPWLTWGGGILGGINVLGEVDVTACSH